MSNVITLETALRRQIPPPWYRRASFGGVVHLVGTAGPGAATVYVSICGNTLGSAEELEEGPYEQRCKDCQRRLSAAYRAAMEEVPARVTTKHVVTITRNAGTADPAEHIARRLAPMRSWEIEIEPLGDALKRRAKEERGGVAGG